MEGLNLFLPVMRRAELDKQGYELWLPELLHYWKVCNNTTNFENVMVILACSYYILYIIYINILSQELMWLLARLARLNIGHIDWEPHMPLMFTRFLRSLNLPVLYKKLHPGRIHKLDLAAVGQWIVCTLVITYFVLNNRCYV